MNLAIRGIDANLGQQNADSFLMINTKILRQTTSWQIPIQHKRLGRRAFKMMIHVGNTESLLQVTLTTLGFYICYITWLRAVAGFVLANGSLSSSTISEYTIRKNLIEDEN